MKRLTTLALMTVLLAPAKVSAQVAVSLSLTCDAPTATPESAAPNLHGNWDFLMAVSGTPNFGLLSVGFVGDRYAGALSLWRTAPVAVRTLTVAGNRFHLAAATPDGDVLFDGTLSAKGDRMCGTVTYHGGQTFPAVAQKRPTTFQAQPQAERSAQEGASSARSR